MKHFRLLFFVSCALLFSACGYLGTAAKPGQAVDQDLAGAQPAGVEGAKDDGCGPSTIPPLDPKHVTSVSGRMYPPILGSGDPTTAADARKAGFDFRAPQSIPGDRTLRAFFADYADDADGGRTLYEVRAYYSDLTISDTDALPDFFKAGGIMLLERTPIGTTVQGLVKAAGDRVTTVSIGPFAGALTWADDLYGSDSIRPYDVWLDDGDYDIKIVGETSTPEEVVDMARSIYC